MMAALNDIQHHHRLFMYELNWEYRVNSHNMDKWTDRMYITDDGKILNILMYYHRLKSIFKWIIVFKTTQSTDSTTAMCTLSLKMFFSVFFSSLSFVHSFFILFFIQFMKERKKKMPQRKTNIANTLIRMIGPSCTIVCNIWKSIKKTNVCIDSKMWMEKQNETKTMNNPFYKHRFNKICIKIERITVKYGLQ